ncbi:hypothetical protein [Methanobrevibacter sp.]|uniref:hypothetical protein n=1 Tax=Methanobrevibacter sp. TaxID=66852 RepID=UPI0038664B30
MDYLRISDLYRSERFKNNSVGSKGHAGSVYFTDSSTVINCSFTDNSAYLGGAIRLRGQNSEVFDCNFINNSASIIGGAVCMDGGRLVNCNFVGNTVGNSDFGGGAVLIYYNGGEVIKCNFTGNSALSDAGALYLLNPAVVSNCNFVTNKASRKGGAVYMNYKDRVENCIFADNSACCGGAIYSNVEGDVAYCRFTGNDASNGSAIYFNSSSTDKRIANSILLKNRADSKALDVNINENKITITFKGCNNLLNAIYSLESVSFTNVTYWGEDGVMNTDEGRYRMSDGESGQNIAVGVIVDDVVVLKDVKVTDADGKVVLDINPRENYLIGIYHDSDSYYTHSERIISDMKFYVNVTSQTTKNRIVNITAKSNIYGEVLRNKLQFILQNGNSIAANYAGDGIWWARYAFDNCGDYNVGASYDGLDNVTVANATIIINRAETELIAAAITATYNVNRNLVITLKDCNGYIVPGVGVSVDLNGHKIFTTDEKGQIKLSTAGLAPKTYAAKIAFAGNNNYLSSSCNVRIVIKKATPKLNAKRKTFRQSEKVKRYGIVLKSNVGKGIERAQVTLKIGKKTYKAKTNAKGKATFKIKKLTRKGTYKATATYKGNRFYNGVVKKVKITVK